MNSQRRSVSRLGFALLLAFTMAWAVTPVSAAYCEWDCGNDCWVWCDTNAECGGAGGGCAAGNNACAFRCGDLPMVIRSCSDFCS